MQKMVNLGIALGLAIWTFVMGGFYGLVNFGGDFIQWLNAAFLGLASHEFGTLVDALQAAGGFICFVIWAAGVAMLFMARSMGVAFLSGNAPRRSRARTVDGPTINGQAREL